MPTNVYIINRTYIAQDNATGLIASGATEQTATDRLAQLMVEYWDKKKVVVPVKTENGMLPSLKLTKESLQHSGSKIKDKKTWAKNANVKL